MNTRRIFIYILAFGLSYSATSALADPLVILEGRGGRTPKGLGHSEVRIQPNGTFEWYDQLSDETFGRADSKAFNGWYQTKLTEADLVRLRKTLSEIDYAAWPEKDTGAVGPSASDGVDETLSTGKHVLRLWQLKGSEMLPLVELVRELQRRYEHKR